MEEKRIIMLESKVHALEELLNVSETSFLDEAEKLEDTNGKLQKKIEEHEKLENDIRQLLDASSDAIRVIDVDYNIVYASKSFSKLKDISSENIIGRKCHEVDPEKECFTEECSLKRILKTGKKFEREVYIKSDGGIETPYMISFVPYNDAKGNMIGIIKIYRDISEQKLAQKTAEENAQKQGRIEMANNMLHDIGNAVTGISAYILAPQLEKDWNEVKSLRQLKALFVSKEKELVDMLGEEKEKALTNFMEALESSLQKRNTSYLELFERMSRTIGHISSILDLQRHYVQDKGPLLSTVVNVNTLIEDTLVMLSESLQKRNILVKINCDERNLSVSGDHTRLIRVFMNLVINIYEAFDEAESTENRKLEINISSNMETRNVEIVLSDNAIGFSQEISGKLFDRGFTTKQNGSGIGLNECRSIIESHGGTITIKNNEENTGAITVIRLPGLTTKRG
ncbi:MAG: hypothetical protein A2020_00845 [Lentisphaerae bacterium GWF2_45_14]|nr:MAG: hypothetical protein A2020_00845 [Lentisphaerae bacterium GWF2_45_14]